MNYIAITILSGEVYKTYWNIFSAIILNVLIQFPLSRSQYIAPPPDVTIIKTFRQEFLQSRQSNWKYPVISNFDAVISHFSRMKCLIIVDNLKQVDFQFRNPVIVRSLVQLLIDAFDSDMYVLAPENPLLFPNASRSKFKCSISNFLVSQPTHHSAMDLCIRLKFPEYWRHAKPWNCYAQIGVFPTNFYYEAYASILYDERQENSQNLLRVFPYSPFTSFKIFLLPGNGHKRSQIKAISDKFMKSSTSGEFCQHVFIIAIVIAKNITLMAPSRSEIGQLELLRICPGWSRDEVLLPIPILDFHSLHNFPRLIHTALPPPTLNRLWVIPNMLQSRGNSVNHPVLNSLQNCNLLKPWSSAMILSTPEKLVAEAHARIWLSIMGNFTLKNSPYGPTICSKSGLTANPSTATTWQILFSMQPYPKELHKFPYYTQDDLRTLHFVTCGYRGFSEIPFSELINVFDKWIWILIVVVIGSVMVPLKILSESEIELRKRWIAPLKILLDQGDPFLERATISKADALRWVIGFYLLVGIVISNAYKSNNVYKMISPRKPIPYETVRELLQDNFTVYTRVIDLHVFGSQGVKPLNLLNQLKNSQGPYDYMHRGKVTVVAVSEIAEAMKTYLMSLRHLYNRLLQMPRMDQSKMAKSGVLSTSIINSVISHQINITLQKAILLRGEITADFVSKERQMLVEAQEEFYLRDLKKCNRAAIILPKELGHKYKLPHVYTGQEESYTDVGWSFTLTGGALPPYLPKSIKSIHENGIWKRWSRLFTTVSVADSGNSEVRAGSMGGNVVIVFLVWLTGMAGSFICAIAERFICTCQNRTRFAKIQ